MKTPLTPQQAALALKEAGLAEKHSAAVYRYQLAAPYLLMWGIIWIIGYGGSDLWPRSASWIWMGLLLAALAISTIIGGTSGSRSGGAHSDWRYPMAFVSIWAFLGATYAVMGQVGPMQQGAFPPLVVALGYVLTGLWVGPRFIVAGVTVAALTLGGFFHLPQHFLLWEGFVGGSALILAGLWFRRV